MNELIAPGNVAVVTGAASGIGLAAARRFARAGMRVCLVDVDPSVSELAGHLGGALGFAVDVSDRTAVQTMAQTVRSQVGPVSVLMNNAGIVGGADALSGPEVWKRVVGVNLLGVLHGVQAFVPDMLAGGRPGWVINTGSKQGITQPPGNTAYNVSKAGVKALTEGLAHTLRQAGGRVSAHLLIPGFTFTGMTGQAQKPDAAWTAEQVVEFMLDGIGRGDFYLLCPDNEVSREIDAKRIAWAAGDLIENRPALSRWHPDYAEAFDTFVRQRGVRTLP